MAPTYPNRARLLRERLLSQKSPALEPVEIDGEVFHLRAPVLADRDRITKLAMGRNVVGDDGKMNDVALDRMLAAALVVLACDEQAEPLFAEADFDDLRQRPVGSWVERLAMRALQKLNPKETPPGEAHDGRPASGSTTSSPTV